MYIFSNCSRPKNYSDQPQHFIHWQVKWLRVIISLQYNVLLGNFESWHSCECHLTCTTHPDTDVDHINSLLAMGLPNSGPPSRTMRLDTLQELLSNSPTHVTNSLETAHSLDHNLIKHLPWPMEVPLSTYRKHVWLISAVYLVQCVSSLVNVNLHIAEIRLVKCTLAQWRTRPAGVVWYDLYAC